MSDKWCKHRTPFFPEEEYPVCKAGINFHLFPRPSKQMPCLGETPEACALCPKYEALSKEELAARDKERAEHWGRITIIRQAIVANIKATKERSGRIPCPCCKTGTVGYSQASNGHVHAGCSTNGCASWME